MAVIARMNRGGVVFWATSIATLQKLPKARQVLLTDGRDAAPASIARNLSRLVPSR